MYQDISWDNQPLPVNDRLSVVYFSDTVSSQGADVTYHGRTVIHLIWRPDGRMAVIDRHHPEGRVQRQQAEEVLKALKKAYTQCFGNGGTLLHAPGTFRDECDEAELRRMAQFDATLVRLTALIERSAAHLIPDDGQELVPFRAPFTRPLIQVA